MATRPAATASRRGFGWHLGVLMAMRLASVAANAAFYVLAARELGVAVFGRSAAIVGVVGLLAVAADFGTSSTVSRDAAAYSDPPSLGAALRHRARGATSTLAVAALLSICLFVAGISTLSALLPVIAVGWTWLTATQSLLAGLLIGRGRTWLGAGVPLVEKAVSIAGFLIVPVVLPAAREVPLRMWGASIAGIAVSVAVAAASERALLRRAWRRRPTRGDSRQSFGFFASAVGAQVQNLDVTLVGWVSGGTAAGLLAAPSRMTTPLGVLASSAASMLLVQERHPGPAGGRDRRLAVVTAAVGILTFTCVSPLIFIPADTARVVLGAAYVPGSGVFRLVAIATCIAAVNQPLAADAQAAFDQARVGFAVAVGAVVGVVTLLAAAPSLGAVGGGWAMISTQIVVVYLLTRARSTRSTRRPPAVSSAARPARAPAAPA